MPAATDYLDPHTLAAIAPLQLRARLIVEGVMTGMHRSPYLGTSVEFAQHRPYAPGDDIRRLDWKVFGRTDKLHLKQYQQETNLDLILLVDVSGSMAYASPLGKTGSTSTTPSRKTAPGKTWSKYDHASCLAAALAYLALQQQDRVGLTLFAGNIRANLRPSNARDHWRLLVDALQTHEPRATPPEQVSDKTTLAGKPLPNSPDAATPELPGEPPSADPDTDLARLLDQVVAKLTQRSLLVLISDLFDDADALERGLARLSHRGHDLIALQVLDPAELHFPFRDASEFIGLESGSRLRLDPAALREAYLEAMQQHQHRIETMTRQFHFDHLLLDSSQHLAAPLSRFLARRAAMLSKGR